MNVCVLCTESTLLLFMHNIFKVRHGGHQPLVPVLGVVLARLELPFIENISNSVSVSLFKMPWLQRLKLSVGCQLSACRAKFRAVLHLHITDSFLFIYSFIFALVVETQEQRFSPHSSIVILLWGSSSDFFNSSSSSLSTAAAVGMVAYGGRTVTLGATAVAGGISSGRKPRRISLRWTDWPVWRRTSTACWLVYPCMLRPSTCRGRPRVSQRMKRGRRQLVSSIYLSYAGCVCAAISVRKPEKGIWNRAHVLNEAKKLHLQWPIKFTWLCVNQVSFRLKDTGK